MRVLILLFIPYLITSCATPVSSTTPISVDFDSPKTITFNESYDNVWIALTSAIIDNDHITEAISKDAGIISTQFSRNDSKTPLWLFSQKSIKFSQITYSNGRTKKKLITPLSFADSRMNKRECKLARFVYTNGGWNLLDPLGDGSPQYTKAEGVESRLSIKVRRISDNQTTVDFKINSKAPVICNQVAANYYNMAFSDSCSGTDMNTRKTCEKDPFHVTKLKVPHKNPIVTSIINSMQNDCKCENDYKVSSPTASSQLDQKAISQALMLKRYQDILKNKGSN